MTGDLVQRLRNPERWVDDEDDLRREAANLIEAQAAKLAVFAKRREEQRDRIMALEAALRQIWHMHATVASEIARRALDGEST